MRTKIEYETNQVIGPNRFIYLKEIESYISPKGIIHRVAIFRCKCGKEFKCPIHLAKSGQRKSCGCSNDRRLKHSGSGTPLYKTWIRMRNRCYYKKHRSYRHYGARGITVYEPWRNDFVPFRDYVLNLPGCGKPGLSLDRIRNNEGYKPGNLRWATALEQTRNRRKQVKKSTIIK